METHEEIYKPIEGFENYSISNQGNIKNNKKIDFLKFKKNRDIQLFH
jgi:hypothetical protein